MPTTDPARPGSACRPRACTSRRPPPAHPRLRPDRPPAGARGDRRRRVEWLSLSGAAPRPADGFPAELGYNALRIPLYLAMAGASDPDLYAPFLALWQKPEAGLALVDTGTGRVTARLAESGSAAIPALAACAARGTPFPAALTRVRAEGENYYPVTLHLLALALAALRSRYPACAPR